MTNKILIDEAVARQALEALENAWLDASMGKGDVARHTEAITALRQALADAALDKMADNARELGLSYDASVAQIDTSAERVEKSAENKHMPAPAQPPWMATHPDQLPPAPPAQEPVAWLFQHEETGLTECVDAQQVEWGFEKNNPRWQKVAPLYTTPPAPAQRTWVGLSEGDKKTPDMGKYVFLSDDWIDGYRTGLEKAEAKLKEKNT
jgi:hypothetical protein